MSEILLFTVLQKVVLYAFLCVIIIYLFIKLITYLTKKRETALLHKHTNAIQQVQQQLWLEGIQAYYDFDKKIMVDQQGSPIRLSEYQENLIPPSFIGNNLATKSIRVGIREYSPKDSYLVSKTLNDTLEPLAGFDTWKIKYIFPNDRAVFKHEVMGELTIEDTPSWLYGKEDVKIYQRVTYIGKDCLIQYELREN